MPFHDFEIRKQEFLERYAHQLPTLKAAAASFSALIEAILRGLDGVNIAKIECRVKNADESVRKFKRKYRNAVEDRSEGYAIADYITDLIGVRVVCLYEDEPPAIMAKVREYFDVIEITDKTAPLEDSESDFGYKGIHMDLRLNDAQAQLSEHRAYAHQAFELQIRTIIQDSWSELDHKIKYKKSIPTNLRRRINILSALFELADREFLQIRNETNHALALMRAEEDANTAAQAGNSIADAHEPLDAFSFVAFGQRHFPGYEFDPQKVEFFIDELVHDFDVRHAPWLFVIVQKHITAVRHYKADFQHRYASSSFNPFTVMRHCLYLEDRQRFRKALRNSAREAFEEWLQTHAATQRSNAPG